ncbi:MAG: hypothetical protein AB7N80_11635 [Bdellovibrionales bacterium]
MRMLACFILMLATFSAQAVVWQSTRTWGNEIEIEYQKWVRDEFPSDIFWRADNPYFNQAGHPFKAIKENPYRGIRVDCADAFCLMRLIFAHAKGLPFAWTAGERTEDGSLLFYSSETDYYDGIQDDVKRLRAYMNVIVAKCSTLTIGLNTYLVNPKKIASGDVYRFNYMSDSALSINEPESRHAHIVKNVSPFGNIHFVWASLPGYPRPFAEKHGAPEKAPITYIRNKPQLAGLGFRRFYQPQDFAMGAKERQTNQDLRGRDDAAQIGLLNDVFTALEPRVKEGAESLTMDVVMQNMKEAGLTVNPNDQLALDEQKKILPFARRKVLQSLAAVEFAGRINEILRVGPVEAVPDRLARMLRNVCSYAKDRAQNVSEGLEARETKLKSNGRASCMSHDMVDAYSTPGRDSQMRAVFEEVYRQWWGDDRNPGLSQAQKMTLDPLVRSTINYIFPHNKQLDLNAPNGPINEELYKFCPINYLTPEYTAVIYKKKPVPDKYKDTRRMDLRQLWIRLVNKRLSPDPHDPVEQRWGEIEKLYSRTKAFNCDAPARAE